VIVPTAVIFSVSPLRKSMFVSTHCFDPLTSTEREAWGEGALLSAAVAVVADEGGVDCCLASAQDALQFALTGGAATMTVAAKVVASANRFIVFIWLSPLANDCIPQPRRREMLT
jgi:hypothetical protein